MAVPGGCCRPSAVWCSEALRSRRGSPGAWPVGADDTRHSNLIAPPASHRPPLGRLGVARMRVLVDHGVRVQLRSQAPQGSRLAPTRRIGADFTTGNPARAQDAGRAGGRGAATATAAGGPSTPAALATAAAAEEVKAVLFDMASLRNQCHPCWPSCSTRPTTPPALHSGWPRPRPRPRPGPPLPRPPPRCCRTACSATVRSSPGSEHCC